MQQMQMSVSGMSVHHDTPTSALDINAAAWYFNLTQRIGIYFIQQLDTAARLDTAA